MLPPKVVWGGGPVDGPSVLKFGLFRSPHHHLALFVGGVGGRWPGGGPHHHHPDGLLVGGGGIYSNLRTDLVL